MSRVGWGILSTGRIAHQFAQDFEHVSNGRVTAVCSRTREAAEAFAAQYGIGRAYDDYAAMLADPEVDAVYVATPHTLHHRNTADAIAAGNHVLCEKPFTVTVEESRNLFHLADRSQRFVMEAMWTYFLPAVRRAVKWVEQGRIGRLRQVRADFGYPLLPYDPARREYDAELGGGCLLDMGIYPIALAWLFLQRDPDDIQVIARTAPNGVEDDLQMLFDYGDNASGCSATLTTSFRSKLPNVAYLIGEESYIAIPDFWRARECALYRLEECVDHYRDGRKSLGFCYETEAAGADILAGRQQNRLMPWRNTIRFQEHIERVRARIRAASRP